MADEKETQCGHPRFYELLKTMAEIHAMKNHDYAGDENDPLRNFRMCEGLGIEAWQGVLVRISDKISRLYAFSRQGKLKVKDESVADTFIDLANYALLGLILYEEKDEGE